MRVLLVLVITATVVFASQTSPTPAQQVPAEVQIVKFGWKKLRNDNLLLPAPNIDGQIREEKQKEYPNQAKIADLESQKRASPGRRASDKDYQFRLKVKNTSAKKIVLIRWAYTFTDPISQKELIRHDFESKVKIGPGSEKDVVVNSNNSPPLTVDIRAKQTKTESGWNEAVVIEELRFEDGSSWTRK